MRKSKTNQTDTYLNIYLFIFEFRRDRLVQKVHVLDNQHQERDNDAVVTQMKVVTRWRHFAEWRHHDVIALDTGIVHGGVGRQRGEHGHSGDDWVAILSAARGRSEQQGARGDEGARSLQLAVVVEIVGGIKYPLWKNGEKKGKFVSNTLIWIFSNFRICFFFICVQVIPIYYNACDIIYIYMVVFSFEFLSWIPSNSK